MAGFPCDSLKMTRYVVFWAYVCVGMYCFMYESLCLSLSLCVRVCRPEVDVECLHHSPPL